MKRLVVFGDSFTYGYGFEDCRTINQPPSQFVWPSLLGKQLNVPVVNKAAPGGSNTEILASILSFDFDPDDLVIIGWTFVTRDIIFKKQILNSKFDRTDHQPLCARRDDPGVKDWLMAHNNYDLSVRSGFYIHHADLYLRSLNLKVIHFSSIEQILLKRLVSNLNPTWFKQPTSKIHYDLLPRIDKAADGEHPGKKSQAKLVDNLLRIINEQ